MSGRFERVSLTVGAVVMCVGFVAAVLYATPQDQGGGPPPPFERGIGPRGRGPGPGMGPGQGPALGPIGPLGPLGMMLPRLGLSDAQKDQIKGIVEARRPDLEAIGKNQGAAMQALEAAELSGESDAVIRQLHANVAATEADAAVARTHVLAEILGMLSPDQQASLKAMREQMLQRMAQPRPPRPQRGQ